MMRFVTLLQDSTIARFSTAMLTSLLLTGATLLPIIAHFDHFGHAAPAAQAAPVPQAYSPPPTTSEQYPDPQPCHGNCSWVHDPSLIYGNDTYWRFTTSGNIAVATAPSLEGPWTYQGPLLYNGTSIRIRDDQDIWVCLSISLHTSPYMLTKNITPGTLGHKARQHLLLPLLCLLHLLTIL
jgi:arabinan endo-1,5-alpha-L-arabinosidase